jgi:hypothetical protein
MKLFIAFSNVMYYFCNINSKNMASAIRISDELVKIARKVSKVQNRSLTGQIEYWAKIGKIAEENPDMPYNLIKDILLGKQEIESGEFSEYLFNEPA